jgi:acylphosphatase
MNAPERTSERVGYRVSGRVQGVGFRWSVARRAEELGLRGSVRNCPDGTVEVAVEGAPVTVRQFAQWLGQGPRGAHVERVEVTSPMLPIPESGFRIVRSE